MIDLNTLLSQALTKALDDALQPILARIAAIESSVQHLDIWSTSTGTVLTDRLTALESRAMTAPSVNDLDDLIDDRIGNYLDNDDLASRIDVADLDGLEQAISNTLEGMDLADTVRPVVEELLTNASITLG